MRYIANPVSVTALRITDVRPEWLSADTRSSNLVLTLEDGSEFMAGSEMTSRYSPVPGDYLVTQEADGYQYLNPAHVFERKYHLQAPLSSPMDDSLNYHRPTPEQTDRIERLREAQKQYARQLELVCPPSRALSIAKTEFETSCMWAVKSIVLEK